MKVLRMQSSDGECDVIWQSYMPVKLHACEVCKVFEYFKVIRLVLLHRHTCNNSVRQRRSAAPLLFSKANKIFVGHFDPENILVDNEKMYFFGVTYMTSALVPVASGFVQCVAPVRQCRMVVMQLLFTIWLGCLLSDKITCHRYRVTENAALWTL